ncbi:hypothetical protein KIN20_001322 [Parelaphostrongylus tenuis]|uniref:SET domain-containing protein n=1 Tax=Parelaphostrongylus tenuis TaxID=148309 RepID=A0AAD5MM08_PARTN|nr:hypothetical protein KIN20_001322 [Parelaphostrongylus tenuis]
MPDDALQKFLDWCHDKGIRSDGLEIRSCQKSGNGLFAMRFFRPDEKLIELPEELIITAGKVADLQKYSELLDETKFFPTSFELLTLFFCIEDSESSFYAPYINVLPKSFTTPSYMKKYIDPVDLPLSARKYWCDQQKELQESWKRIHEVVPEIPYEKFLWAWHVVNTRCIYMENKSHVKVDNSAGDTLAVIPFVDMLNHDPSAKGLAGYDSYSNKYIVRSTHCIMEDEEVTVCYGAHDNARLWMEYGFTLPSNPNGKVIIEIDQFISLANNIGLTVSSQHKHVLHSAGLPCTLYLSDEGPSWALRTNAKILMLSLSDMKRWRELIYTSLPSDRTNESNLEKDDVKDTVECQALEKIILELKQAVTAGLSKAPQDLKWIWQEQLMIIDATLSYFTH